MGDLKHRLTVRLTDEHVARLECLAGASGLKRNEVMRRALLEAEIPSARTRQEVQDLLRIQREQNRLGGLLKKALTEREEKAALRRTLVEVERNAIELRRVIARLVRSR
ncbi:MAG: ribbon-helix-helix protein, CopG family [Myxococcales bacterium]|nr:ribbon-helix-helix protein, CopG family [Myxococcales bacterium]